VPTGSQSALLMHSRLLIHAARYLLIGTVDQLIDSRQIDDASSFGSMTICKQAIKSPPCGSE